MISDEQLEEIEEETSCSFLRAHTARHNINILLKEVRRLKKCHSALGSFVEYFDAISRGEYDKNRRPAPLRTLELTFLEKGRKALGWKEHNNPTKEDS